MDAKPTFGNWLMWLLVLRVTSCLEKLENLKMSGNLTAVREMSGILLKVMEKSRQGKVA